MVKQYLQLRFWRKICEFPTARHILNRNHVINDLVRNKEKTSGWVGHIVMLDGRVVHASELFPGFVTFVGNGAVEYGG